MATPSCGSVSRSQRSKHGSATSGRWRLFVDAQIALVRGGDLARDPDDRTCSLAGWR